MPKTFLGSQSSVANNSYPGETFLRKRIVIGILVSFLHAEQTSECSEYKNKPLPDTSHVKFGKTAPITKAIATLGFSRNRTWSTGHGGWCNELCWWLGFLVFAPCWLSPGVVILLNMLPGINPKKQPRHERPGCLVSHYHLGSMFY